VNYIVVGGGVSGLMAAHRLRSADSDARITLIERSANLGGLLAGTEYPDQGLYFDQGTHIFQETGDATIDAILCGAVAPENLLMFPAGEGDLAGIVFKGRLQENSYFPDLRRGNATQSIVAAIRKHLEEDGPVPDIDRTADLLTVATARFGKVYAESLLAPMLAKLYSLPAERLSAFAMILPGLTRVIIDDFDAWLTNTEHLRYRAIAGNPDQRRLPPHMRHGRRSFYSRRRGSRAFVDGLENALRTTGVEIATGTAITSIDLRRCALLCTRADGVQESFQADGMVLSTGAIGAANLLGVDIKPFSFDPPMPHWIVNLLVERSSRSDLCYMYGLDDGCDWYRLTNYRAFSGDAHDRRLTIEVVGHRSIDPATLPAKLAAQLRDAGILDSDAATFADAHRLPAGFPSPTFQNLQAMTQLGEHISSMLPSNIMLGGIGSRPGLFFQNEVVADIYKRTGDLLPSGSNS
jgi:hypothetical protein